MPLPLAPRPNCVYSSALGGEYIPRCKVSRGKLFGFSVSMQHTDEQLEPFTKGGSETGLGYTTDSNSLHKRYTSSIIFRAQL